MLAAVKPSIPTVNYSVQNNDVKPKNKAVETAGSVAYSPASSSPAPASGGFSAIA